MPRAFLGGLILCGLIGHASAESRQIPDDGTLKAGDLATRAELAQRLAEVTSDEEKHRQALYLGQMRTRLCRTCHGEDGNSQREATPSLAGQNPVYIVDQFNRYADGRRQDFWMSGLAKSFSERDKIQLAVFYSQQNMKPAGGGRPELLERGREIYAAFCVECHGADGKGSEGYARLAGQRPEYIVKMLREFRTANGKRYNPWMYGRANMLKSADDFEAVATYLAHLK